MKGQVHCRVCHNNRTPQFSTSTTTVSPTLYFSPQDLTSVGVSFRGLIEYLWEIRNRLGFNVFVSPLKSPEWLLSTPDFLDTSLKWMTDGVLQVKPQTPDSFQLSKWFAEPERYVDKSFHFVVLRSSMSLNCHQMDGLFIGCEIPPSISLVLETQQVLQVIIIFIPFFFTSHLSISFLFRQWYSTELQ